jgi:hypothetical protein
MEQKINWVCLNFRRIELKRTEVVLKPQDQRALRICITLMRILIHIFTLMRIRIRLFTLIQIRIRLITLMWIWILLLIVSECESAIIGLQTYTALF